MSTPNEITTPESPPAELVRVLTSEIPSQRIADVLNAGLAAVTVNRDGSTSPDHRCRVECSKLLLLYRLGKPLERQEHVHFNVIDDAASIQDRVDRSPALRAALQHALDRAAIPV